MKRHPGLRDLSSDHHHGLVHARHLLLAAADPAAVAVPGVVAGFLQFWTDHTNDHFRAEEEILLPAFDHYGAIDQAPIVRILLEHIHIRRLVDDLRREAAGAGATPATLRDLAVLFRAHIRYEEDVVFPLIEAAMPEAALQELGAALATVHRS